jgi:uncharacterized repeat protein (TIGR03803 family)
LATGSYGTLFKVTPGGQFTKLFDFNPPGGIVLGYYPVGGMIQASDGNLYGTTEWGGPSGCSCGTVFQLAPNGTVTQIAEFDDANTGRWPLSVPLQAADGTLLVTNSRGPSVGSHDPGTIMQIDNALPKPKPSVAAFSPASGTVGQKVTIVGVHFVGTTAVSFNGTSAPFLVKASGALIASVPAGATTGHISVTNAGGSGTSAGTFTVLP